MSNRANSEMSEIAGPLLQEGLIVLLHRYGAVPFPFKVYQSEQRKVRENTAFFFVLAKMGTLLLERSTQMNIRTAEYSSVKNLGPGAVMQLAEKVTSMADVEVVPPTK